MAMGRNSTHCGNVIKLCFFHTVRVMLHIAKSKASTDAATAKSVDAIDKADSKNATAWNAITIVTMCQQ